MTWLHASQHKECCSKRHGGYGSAETAGGPLAFNKPSAISRELVPATAPRTDRPTLHSIICCVYAILRFQSSSVSRLRPAMSCCRFSTLCSHRRPSRRLGSSALATWPGGGSLSRSIFRSSTCNRPTGGNGGDTWCQALTTAFALEPPARLCPHPCATPTYLLHFRPHQCVSAIPACRLSAGQMYAVKPLVPGTHQPCCCAAYAITHELCCCAAVTHLPCLSLS